MRGRVAGRSTANPHANCLPTSNKAHSSSNHVNGSPQRFLDLLSGQTLGVLKSLHSFLGLGEG